MTQPSGYLSKRNENLSSHKNLYMNVYSNFFQNHDSLKTENNPNILQLVNGETVVHPCNRILLNSKKLMKYGYTQEHVLI